MNQNMFSLIKQIGYWLPMLRKALSNKIQVTKKRKGNTKAYGKARKELPDGFLYRAKRPKASLSLSKKKEKKL